MSLAVLKSRALAGMEAPEVTVEVHLGRGLPSFTIVGLADTEVKEARERVRAAIQNARFEFPASRITVNLAPADLPKESGRFDLPIALGILAASGQIDGKRLAEHEFAGELSLTGELRPIRGALAMCLAARGDSRSFVLPAESAAEAALVGAAAILPAKSLLEVCAHLNGQQPLLPFAGAPAAAQASYPDLSEVKGQAQAKRALEVAAAGGHSLLMIGPPGTGKSMLAARFAGLLPPMDDEEALETAALHSLNGGFRLAHWKQRPYQAPHHTASSAALVGGGSNPRPGEISLAHHGVLFLDELPEFERRVLEALREPLESGHIRVARAAHRVDYPAQFQLVAAMNPCPCGHLGEARCRCTPDQVARYRGKLSGPLLDRIDMTIEVPALAEGELQGKAAGESSAAVQARVTAARQAQRMRQGKPNSRLATKEIDKLCAPDDAGAQLLKQAIARLNLSARAYHRVLKVARTVADLAASKRLSSAHIAEAIHYRRAAGADF
ncbi:MAG: ATP-dependent protease [Betaproteobacteria bacterium HGW-Betaproteobacteria-14]|nr:MAG: ATP-dependent protease [Betaproteobacteria bacterium HGW-Betaproteobacteria-14]